ncbi:MULTISPECIES: TIGR02234 family membrane protein [unclassified Rhodococcus (in: high G+C Gram-positive bacteria)]|uniref:TIGR02234 family membrane protein n=1 Tax=unclassified Rhodococcus (in: high G+C Gram-positive bacteria) TaxID=192944 RepID=UPI001639696A|nr:MULTISPECIES: TIGR02234 family membrane protein [unclassified Rhodococcus (in: high G+C Gram-positive bacteria)]MBC2638471.1 TIGR02234 family membrane protein [Rhodococcus sp. 3A]MBC2896788.1 TIGR02234 family membrane protein [Rhodococcus sp. 4CII]
MSEASETVREPARAGGRRSMIAVLLLAVAAVCLWGASRMTWVEVTSSDGLGEARTAALVGGTWAAALTPLALTLVAAIAASFAVKGWALRVLGVLVAVVAVAAAVPAVRLIVSGASDDEAGRLAELPGRAEVQSVSVHVGPAVLVLIGALAALVAAVELVRRPRVRAGLSSKYDSPGARRDAAKTGGDSVGEPVTQRMLWDALDAGEDPTVDDKKAEAVDQVDDDGRDPGTRT